MRRLYSLLFLGVALSTWLFVQGRKDIFTDRALYDIRTHHARCSERKKTVNRVEGADTNAVYRSITLNLTDKKYKQSSEGRHFPGSYGLGSRRLHAVKYEPCFLKNGKQEDERAHSSSSYRIRTRRKSHIAHAGYRTPATKDLRDRVLLVDGTGLAYRCFFALPTLTTYRGTEIGAIVGFMNSLARLYKTLGPKYVGIVFDSPGANNSKRAVWPEYKANRPMLKSSFKKQLLWIKELCAIVGLPVFLKRTTEADDIIASMISFLRSMHGDSLPEDSAEQEVQQMRPIEFRVPAGMKGGVFDRIRGSEALQLDPIERNLEISPNQKKFDIYVLTADKDLLQVLENNDSSSVNVRIVQPHKKFRHVDEDIVRAEYGIPPERFSEYLALVGDSADNIPGVMGVGPKTAPILISKYGSFKEIVDSEEIAKIAKKGGRYSLSVEKASDFHLITKLRTDVPVITSLADLCKKRILERQFVEFCKLFSLQKCAVRWQDVTH